MRSTAFTPDGALESLLEGNARFVGRRSVHHNLLWSRDTPDLDRLVAAIISCSEEPVHPALVFDQNPQDLFLVTLPGNIVSGPMFGGLRYAVGILGAPLIVVLGHSSCRVISDLAEGSFPWRDRENARPPAPVHVIPEPLRRVLRFPAEAEGLSLATEANVRSGVHQLSGAEPFRTLLENRTLRVIGATLDGNAGLVNLLDCQLPDAPVASMVVSARPKKQP